MPQASSRNDVVPAGPLFAPIDAAGASAPETLGVALIPPRDLVDLVPAWHDLAARAVDPNVFLAPDFAVPALAHLYPRACRILIVRKAGRLLALMPVILPPIGRGGLARGVVHAQAALGTPLLDAAAAAVALEAIVRFLRTTRPDLVGVAFSSLPQAGGVFAHLQRQAAADGAALTILAQHRRAILPRGTPFDAHLRAAVTGRRQKEFRRQARRLADAGALVFSSAETPAAVAAATEAFLALEGRGWKGARATALVSRPKLATFARAMTRGLAQRGLCRIDALHCDGTPIAMGIVLRTGDTAAFWKTTYDERFAGLSPGVQLALRLTARQLADPATALTDSCAVADHPMIDRLWPARMTIVDVVLPLRHSGDAALRRVLRRDAARRRLRQVLKDAVNRLRGRARS